MFGQKRFKNGVYYDRKANAFIKIQGFGGGYYLCGHHCPFFSDALRQTAPDDQLSPDYIRDNCEIVGALDKADYAEFEPITLSWRVKERRYQRTAGQAHP